MAKMVTTAPENGHVGDILLDVMAPFRARSPLDSARAEYVQLDLLDLAAIQLMGGSTSSTSLQSSLYKTGRGIIVSAGNCDSPRYQRYVLPRLAHAGNCTHPEMM